MFWRLFLTYLLFVFAAVALVGAFILNRAETLFRELAWNVAAGVALIALLAVVPAYAIARRFAQPVVDLNEGARRLADGDFGHKIAVAGSPDHVA
jgi:two-component system phosphate regulon sensor histidine kinase PhoR